MNYGSSADMCFISIPYYIQYILNLSLISRSKVKGFTIYNCMYIFVTKPKDFSQFICWFDPVLIWVSQLPENPEF